MHISHERVADEFHRNTGIGVKLFFKGKDTKSVREAPPHQIYAPRPPGPELRANVVDVSNTLGWHVGWRRNQWLAGNSEGSAERLDSMGRCSSCSLYCNW